VFRLLILEALVLGAVGTALGVGAGIVLGRLLLPMVTDSMGINFQLRFHTHEMHLNARQLLVAAAVGISTAVGASWFPARTARRALPRTSSGWRSAPCGGGWSVRSRTGWPPRSPRSPAFVRWTSAAC